VMPSSTVDLDPARVRAIIRSQFPDVGAQDVRWLGEGYDSTAFEVDRRWVFRFPKRRDVEQQLLVESRILPVLAETSPLPLPVFRYHGSPGELFPRHYVGYPRIGGELAIRIAPEATPFRAFVDPIARFLSWLHAYPVDDAAAHGVPDVPPAGLLDEAAEDAVEDLSHVERVSPEGETAPWRRFLGTPPRAGTESAPRLVHGDLAAEHVLVDVTARTVTGIIDWSEIGIGDVAVDLAALFHWGGPTFAAAVLRQYDLPIDSALLHRARYLAACRGAADVTFGIATDRPEYVHAGLRALHYVTDAVV
jgi:aminoglycoside phosphotransferase (APT) family kinase protein